MKHGFEIIRLLCSLFLTTWSQFAFAMLPFMEQLLNGGDDGDACLSAFSAFKPLKAVYSSTIKNLDRKRISSLSLMF